MEQENQYITIHDAILQRDFEIKTNQFTTVKSVYSFIRRTLGGTLMPFVLVKNGDTEIRETNEILYDRLHWHEDRLEIRHITIRVHVHGSTSDGEVVFGDRIVSLIHAALEGNQIREVLSSVVPLEYHISKIYIINRTARLRTKVVNDSSVVYKIAGYDISFNVILNNSREMYASMGGRRRRA